MKKVTIIAVLLCFILIPVGCKKETKDTKLKEATASNLAIDPTSVEVKWTAYKTTDKIAVSGVFKEVNLSNENGNSIDELIDGLAFSIPVSSIFSNNADRDSKLQQFFFGVMGQTELLSGALNAPDSGMVVSSITMNTIKEQIQLSYSVEQDTVKLSGVLDLNKWNGQEAIESINKACFDLHKGADGVSKTWNDVQVDIKFAVIK